MPIFGSKTPVFWEKTTFFGVFRVFSLFFYFEVWNKSWISLISWENTSLLWKNQKISNRSCHKNCRVSSPLNPMRWTFFKLYRPDRGGPPQWAITLPEAWVTLYAAKLHCVHSLQTSKYGVFLVKCHVITRLCWTNSSF